MRPFSSLLLQAFLCIVLVNALPPPAPTATPFLNANAAVPQDPIITPAVTESQLLRAAKLKRGVKSDIDSLASDVTGAVGSVLSSLGKDIPSYVASGVPNFFQGFPTGNAVQSSLGLDDAQVSAYPTNVLNIDPYANYTDQGWNVRFHGNVYKQPDTSTQDLNKFANGFLIDTQIQSLPESEQDQARNLTAEILVITQANANVSTIHLQPVAMQGGMNTTTSTAGTQDVLLPLPADSFGDFDEFVPIQSNGLMQGNATQKIQRLQTYVDGATLGNSTAYLVPDTGLTVISDIDDILRITKIYEPKLGILNTFAKPFIPWENMPEIYANWSKSLPNLHFHYLTTTPEQITRNYMSFINADYPPGTFDVRPLNDSSVEETLSVRKFLLQKIFETFPKRRFILIADTSNSDVMKDYPAMVTEFPGQVQCIFLRNTTATDSGDQFPYDTSGFKNIHQDRYMFFVHANDLMNLDIANAQCYNTSIAQNLTFGYQGLPLGAGSTTSTNGSANHTGSASSVRNPMGLSFFAFLSTVFWQLFLL